MKHKTTEASVYGRNAITRTALLRRLVNIAKAEAAKIRQDTDLTPDARNRRVATVARHAVKGALQKFDREHQRHRGELEAMRAALAPAEPQTIGQALLAIRIVDQFVAADIVAKQTLVSDPIVQRALLTMTTPQDRAAIARDNVDLVALGREAAEREHPGAAADIDALVSALDEENAEAARIIAMATTGTPIDVADEQVGRDVAKLAIAYRKKLALPDWDPATDIAWQGDLRQLQPLLEQPAEPAPGVPA